MSEGADLNDKYLDGFAFIEHPDNIALALDVCEEIGVKKEVAIEGMRSMVPDPGALTITSLLINKSKVDFVNAFAANDPQSTLKTWNIISEYVRDDNKKIAIFLNTRSDRQLRTQQLLDMIFSRMQVDYLIARGDNLDSEIQLRCERIKTINYSVFQSNDNTSKIIDRISRLDNYLVIGIGNIVGWGEGFMRQLKEYRND